MLGRALGLAEGRGLGLVLGYADGCAVGDGDGFAVGASVEHVPSMSPVAAEHAPEAPTQVRVPLQSLALQHPKPV